MKEKIIVKLQSIFLAALFLMVFGGVWYGILFHNVQMESHGYSAEDYANNNPIWYLGGAIISMFIAWGIGLLLRLGSKKGLSGGILASTRAIIAFGIPLVSYPLVFSPYHDFKLYAVGLFQIIIAWTVAGAIIGRMSYKE
jgi:hypothetical protein